MRKLASVFIICLIVALLSSCNVNSQQQNINKVGMLVEGSINDQSWGSKGYKGLLEIKEQFDVDVYFKEGVTTQQQVNHAIEEFANQGVNLVFGHSSIYGKMFKDIANEYPDVHFVYFNGGYSDDNLTSLNFSSHAMGFFGGMVAGKMTKTNQVGIIAAHEWQPEIEGFFEGVNYQNPNAEVKMEFVNGWDNTERALDLFKSLKEENVDVYYPAGDSFSAPVINRVREAGLYAIGFVTDQSNLGENTVLTSTVQYANRLYVQAAEDFNVGELQGGIFTFDFQDGVVEMGDFSPKVPGEFVADLERHIDNYKEDGLLPNER
ncbi:BMP family ABC transporter substrate-binding protein [Radiobacillus kanasensis]|nr:BMP family ABC transporter substrate-binding protein [Radiobacillus kanasensis]UFU00558.1 BMP family ABC transporter substrate-binding protein [Radiobacillus kanasensis]